MPRELADGFMLLTLVDVYAQQMGGPGFMLRDDQMRQFWYTTLDQPDHLGTFLEHLRQRVIAVGIMRYALPEGHPHLPQIDPERGFVTFLIGPNTVRVNLARNCIENLEGPLEELPQYIRVYTQPAHIFE
jgi:hypothetical protein